MEWGEQSYNFVVPVWLAIQDEENERFEILQILEDFTFVTTKE